jgi:hypothetical protein
MGKMHGAIIKLASQALMLLYTGQKMRDLQDAAARV